LRASNAAARYTDATVAPPSTPLVFDRATGGLVGLRIDDPQHGDRWVDPTLSAVQTAMESLFPERRVRLIDWDDARERVLALVDSASDPGRYFVYRRTTGRCVEYLRRAPWLTAERRHPVTVFTFSTQDGRYVQGRLTLPLAPVVSPAPMMCLFTDGPWQEAPAGFDRTSQTLAELGCMVLEIDPGLANGRRRAAAPLMRVSPDRVVLEDLMAAIGWVAERHAINNQRVAAFGIGYGGWLALRAAEQRPEAFRCVVSLNGIDTPHRLFDRPREPDLPDGTARGFQLARDMSDYMEAIKSDFEESERAPGTSRLRIAERMMSQMEVQPVNLPAEMSRWYFEPARENADALSVVTHAGQLQCPLFLAFDANGPPAPASDARRLRRQLEREKNPPEFWEVPPADWNRTLVERPEVWQRIDAFLQEKLYRYDVDIGEAKEVAP
jgi:pimeloyl-ACP methyl ester carboxylesterase